MPDQLNDLERRVLDYIIGYLRANTYQPSIREIGREFSIKSTKTVSELLQSLTRKGWIERDPSRSRGVRLIGVEMRSQAVSLPVFEAADATAPSYQIELDRRIVPAHGAFVLPMTGDHLTEDGVRAGDLLVIEPVDAATLHNGDLVLAHVAGAAAARRFMRTGTQMSLESVRPGEVPLTLTPRQAASIIRGRVTGLVRRLRASARDEPAAVVALPAT